MPSNKSVSDSPIIQFINCRILREHTLQREDLWIRDGKILDPEKLFFDEQGYADQQLDCGGGVLAPGFIDVQINGSASGQSSQRRTSRSRSSGAPPGGPVHQRGEEGSPPGAVPADLPVRRDGGPDGDLRQPGGRCHSDAGSRAAPQPVGGHSVADLSQAEDAVRHGASFITHLFNAMLPFHHRDPGIVGLLTSDQIPAGRTVFYGMIADGIHTNPAALRIAHRAHPSGLVLVTDAITAMGLPPGHHTLGQQVIEIQGLHAYVAGLRLPHSGPAGTKTLSGSIATMDMCVRHFKQATGCSVEEALEAASLHPAQLLGISHRKGNLDYGADADLVLLDDGLRVRATYISGEEVWRTEA
ncbi:N-acetylglucosamine-6-phosphate deacetylase isoform 3-T3 [Anableps anableps]